MVLSLPSSPRAGGQPFCSTKADADV